MRQAEISGLVHPLAHRVLSKDEEIRAVRICISANVASMQRVVVTTTPENVPAR